MSIVAKVINESGQDFINAHGSIQIGDVFYLGERICCPSKIIRYNNPNDLSDFDSVIVDLPGMDGQIESMCYDSINNLIYATCIPTVGGVPYKLAVISISPDDISIQEIVFYDDVLVGGGSPAICTDGIYIYGVTYRNPEDSELFKIQISDGTIVAQETWTDANNGHAIKIFEYAGTTELYATSINGKFAKIDASDLSYVELDISADVDLPTDEFWYENIDDNGGYCYVVGEGGDGGGIKIKTEDMTTTAFESLPSYGIFSDGTNLYSMGYEGFIQIYENFDITVPHTYAVYPAVYSPNEFFYSSEGKLFFTHWDDNALEGQLLEFGFADITILPPLSTWPTCCLSGLARMQYLNHISTVNS